MDRKVGDYFMEIAKLFDQVGLKIDRDILLMLATRIIQKKNLRLSEKQFISDFFSIDPELVHPDFRSKFLEARKLVIEENHH